MKKRVMSVLIAITMLAGMGTIASAANNAPDFPSVSPAISIDEETGSVYMECAQDFLDFYEVTNFADTVRGFYNDFLLAGGSEVSNGEFNLEAEIAYLKDTYGIDAANADEVLAGYWEFEGQWEFYEEIGREIGASIHNIDDYFANEDTQRLLYICFIGYFEDENGDTPYSIGIDSTMEEVIEYIYVDMFGEAVPGESTTEATTEEVTEPTTADGEEETTAEEVTEPTTANGEEETTAEDTTASTTAKDNSQNPSTGDPSMLLYGALAAVGGLGALATKKRK